MKNLNSYIKTARKAQKIDLPFSNQEFRKMAVASKLSSSANQSRIAEKLMSNFGKTIMITTAAIIVALIATINYGIFSDTDAEENSTQQIATTSTITETNIDNEVQHTSKMEPENSYSDNKVFASKSSKRNIETAPAATILPAATTDESALADITVNDAELIEDIAPVIIADNVTKKVVEDFAKDESTQETEPNIANKEELLAQIEVLKRLVEKSEGNVNKKYKKNRFGLTFGYNQARNFKTMLDIEVSNEYEYSIQPASLAGYSLGLVYEYLIGNPINNRMSFLIKANYSTLPTLNQDNGETYVTKVPEYDQDGNLISTKDYIKETFFSSQIDYNVASLEFLYRVRPFSFSNLGIVAGTTFDYTLYTYYIAYFDLTKYTNAVGGDANSYKILNEGKIDDAEKFRIGLKAGLQYDIEIGSSFYITPALFYNAGLTSLSRDKQWTIDAFQASIDFKFAF